MRVALAGLHGRIASYGWRRAIIASRAFVPFAVVLLLLAGPAWAGLALHDRRVYTEKDRPDQLVIHPRVTRSGKDVNRPWEWEAKITPRGPRGQVLTKVAKSVVAHDVAEPDRDDKLQAGTYDVTVRVYFADRLDCDKCVDVVKTTEITLVEPPQDTWAVIIGIAKYRTDSKAGHPEEAVPEDEEDRVSALDDLRYSAFDAERLYELLTDVLGIPHERVVLLTSGGSGKPFATLPTALEITSTLQNLQKRVKYGDTVLVFYSGHGIIGWGDWYLAPVDTKVDDQRAPQWGSPISAAAFDHLTDFAQASGVTVVLDACFSGFVSAARSRVKGVAVGNPKSPKALFQGDYGGRSRVMLTATEPNKEMAAYEIYIDPTTREKKLVRRDSPKNATGHGLFTFFLLAGFEQQLAEKNVFVDLNGDGRCGDREDCPAMANRQLSPGVQLTLDPLKAYYHARKAAKKFVKEIGVDQLPWGVSSGEPPSIVSRRRAE